MDDVHAVDRDLRAWVFRFHLGDASVLGTGSFEVRRGTARSARIICRLLRLPRDGSAVPVRVHILRQGGQEVWSRTIGQRVYVSRQVWLAGLVRERIGPLELHFRVAFEKGCLSYQQDTAMLRVGRLTVRLDERVAPQVRARAVALDEHSFFVRVDVCEPRAVPLFSYWGVVEEEASPWR